MSKYIVEIKPEYEDSFKGLMILGAKNSDLFVDALAVDDLELLNSDYINEHFGELQDEVYQRGLDDAWQAARKIALMDTETSEKVTGYFGLFRIMENLTPMQAIAKLKAYEEKQKEDEINVGDEVEWTGDKYIVTYINYDSDKSEITDYDLLGDDGSVADHVKKCSFTKTGRHFNIDKILEEMRHD